MYDGDLQGMDSYPVVILSGARSAESKNLRIIDSAVQTFGAKILRLPLVAQDDRHGSRMWNA